MAEPIDAVRRLWEALFCGPEPVSYDEAYAIIAKVFVEVIRPVREQEAYWRGLIEGGLCGVDHREPHISHDCVALAQQRVARVEAEKRELVKALRKAERLMDSTALDQEPLGDEWWDTFDSVREALAKAGQP